MSETAKDDEEIEIKVILHEEADEGIFVPGMRNRARDHFSLSTPSGSLQLKQKDLQVFSNNTKQFVIERDGDNFVARIVKDGSMGLLFLRIFYTLITLLMTGFLFVFCVDVILFLFFGLAIASGATSQSVNAADFIFILLSVPVFTYSLASFMTIATAFVNDVWSGNRFMNTIGNWDDVKVEWLSFLIFLIVPILTATIVLFIKSERWWEITAMTWVSCVFFYFLVFMICVIFYEIKGCLELVKFNPELNLNQSNDNDRLLSWDVINRAAHIQMKQMLSPVKHVSYILKGNLSEDEREREHLKEDFGFFHKVALSSCMSIFFTKLDEEKEIPTIDEIRNNNPIITAETWSLEKLNFLDRSRRIIAVMGGESSLHPTQVISTFICSIMGLIIPILLVSAILVWLSIPAAGVVIVAIVMIIATLWRLKQTSKYFSSKPHVKVWIYYVKFILFSSFFSSERKVELFQMIRRVQEQIDSTNTIVRMRKSYRVAEPTELLCWIFFAFHVVVWYIIPLVGLYSQRNYEITSVFLVCAVVNGLRGFINISACLQEIGSMDGVGKNNSREEETWAEEHRLNLIVGKISQGRRIEFWVYVFYIIVFVVCVLFLGAMGLGVTEGDSEGLPVLLTDFQYPRSAGLPYPTCRMGTLKNTPKEPENAMVDFVFLSYLAYADPKVTQEMLDTWFGPNVALDQHNTTTKVFQKEYQQINGENPVRYKLIEFPENELSVIDIRGTSNLWDALADTQLWISAMIAQAVRSLMPLGGLWNPIINLLLQIISSIEAESIESVSYYKETTAFANMLKEKTQNIIVTGHSLGGGLAMITGAQASLSAVALSGPNVMLSRNTFDPPITVEAINTLLFNIVPKNDPVPAFDDKGPLFQNIDCTAPISSLGACHSSLRSLCEVLHTCGSENRAVMCECHTELGYEKPDAIGNRTFEEACGV